MSREPYPFDSAQTENALEAIATITEDYQAGTLPTPTPAHVENWIKQFPGAVQQPILAEMEHVLAKTYYSKANVKRFIKRVIHHTGWTGGDPTAFWRQVHFLDIQPRGNSQSELLALFDRMLQKECGISIANCAHGNKFLYLDDGMFSGGRLSTDLEGWIRGAAPQDAQLYIAVIALHAQGLFFKKKELAAAIAQSQKNITISWGRAIEIQDGLFAVDTSDVLRPTSPGNDLSVSVYIASLGKAQTWRAGNNVGTNNFFSSNQGREVLEQEFLKMGIEVRRRCPLLGEYQRPLGNTTMKSVGFGTMFVTYRNCPNNTPLVLWAGDPWYPLFRRITN